MTIQTKDFSLQGHRLHRLLILPNSEPRGSLLFFHGQGDHIDRYPEVLAPFVQTGFQCLLTDLPGHGRSSGRRGVVPGLAFTDAFFKESLSHLPGPRIIAGHSMGGLMALRYFLRAPDQFAAAWFSSPLLDPIRQAPPVLRTLLPIAATLTPWLTVSTGVKNSDCETSSQSESSRTSDPEALYHDRISIGWGRDLRDAAAEVRDQLPGLPSKIPILFTQGGADRICPARLLREYLKKTSARKLTLSVIPEALHEPFRGDTLDEFMARLGQWIRETL